MARRAARRRRSPSVIGGSGGCLNEQSAARRRRGNEAKKVRSSQITKHTARAECKCAAAKTTKKSARRASGRPTLFKHLPICNWQFKCLRFCFSAYLRWSSLRKRLKFEASRVDRLLAFSAAWRRTNYWRLRNVGGPKSLPFIGNLHQLQERDGVPLAYKLRSLTKEFGATFGLLRGWTPAIVTSDPQMAHDLFTTRFDDFYARDVCWRFLTISQQAGCLCVCFQLPPSIKKLEYKKDYDRLCEQRHAVEETANA